MTPEGLGAWLKEQSMDSTTFFAVYITGSLAKVIRWLIHGGWLTAAWG
jgi:hypothetical protein